MSNRRSAFDTPSKNPATKYISWKSNDKKFSFYNKETGEDEFIDLPFKFLALQEMHSVGGFNDDSSSGIYSNEVKLIGTQELEVKCKSGLIAKGLYKSIKGQVSDNGGYYIKVVYGMIESGDIVKITLKGSSVSEWSEFTKKTKTRLVDEWVIVKSADDRKKGSVKYSVPIFEFDKSLSKKEGQQADSCFDELEEYFKAPIKDEKEAVSAVGTYEVDNVDTDDLPF